MSTGMNGDEGDGGQRGPLSRREFLKIAGIAGAGLGFSSALWGCGGGGETTTTEGATTTTAGVTTTESVTTTAGPTTSVSTEATGGRPVKVGLTMPKTGAYAAFAEPMDFLIEQFKEATADGLVMGDGLNHPIELKVVDTQSDSARAAQVAGDLINNEKVDVVMSGGGPEVVLPVADQCEATDTPSLSTNTPWEPWVFGRKGSMDKPFQWTYLACNGITEFVQADTHTIGLIPTNKKVALLLANTADGQAWADPKTGFPPALEAAGFTVVMPSLYPPGAEDFTAQITQFKKEGCEVCLGSPSVPDLTNFWNQALQQSYHPVILLMGLPLMFPAAPTAIGPTIYNASCEVNWHPKWPFKSTLTGQSGQELVDAYEATTGLQWSMVLGSNHHAFEWTADVLKRTKNIDDKQAIMDAVKNTNITTVNGHYDFTAPLDPGPGEKHPHPNVAAMGMGSGQWVEGSKWPFEVVQVGCIMPELEVATTATMQPMQYS